MIVQTKKGKTISFKTDFLKKKKKKGTTKKKKKKIHIYIFHMFRASHAVSKRNKIKNKTI
jgi:hypothetical protein